MAISIEKKLIAMQTITCTALEPEYLGITEEKLDEYVKEHPFPKDEHYSWQDLLNDIESTGSWTFDPEIGEAMIDWLETMIYDLS